MDTLKILGALAVLATVGTAFATNLVPQTARAQTAGMEHRSDRRDTRQTSRAVKHTCNATSGNSRAECRHGKHEVKQAGRYN